MDSIMAYFDSNTEQYLNLLIQHIQVSVSAVLIATIIAVPLGILGSQYKWVEKTATAFTGLMRIIPSLAILFVLIPYTGTGMRLAVIALIFLAIPPILINTIVGFTSVSTEVLEAAISMGMSNRRLFWEIKAPLAFPKVFSGIRTSSVEVISNATLASYIGAGGLGNLIFTGLSAMRMEYLIIGGASVALLSVIVGLLMTTVDHRVRRYEFIND